MGHSIPAYTIMKLVVVLLAGLCLATAQHSSGQRRFARQVMASNAPLQGEYSLQTADGSFQHSGSLHMDPAALARFRDYGMQMFGIMNSAQGRSSGGFGGYSGYQGGFQGGYQIPFGFEF